MSYSTPFLIFFLQTSNDDTPGGSSWSPEGREHCLQDESSGILSSLKRSLRWPLHVSQTVCAVPRRVFNWLHGKVWATGVHLRDNAEDYVFLYELLSVSLPLLMVLHEQLVQMYADAEPLDLQPVQRWLEEHMAHWVLAWEKHHQVPLKGLICRWKWLWTEKHNLEIESNRCFHAQNDLNLIWTAHQHSFLTFSKSRSEMACFGVCVVWVKR